jgi:hypothetical protein
VQQTTGGRCKGIECEEKALWTVAPCVSGRSRRFDRTCRLHLQGREVRQEATEPDGKLSFCGFLLDLFLDHEDGGDIFSRNVVFYPNYSAFQLTRPTLHTGRSVYQSYKKMWPEQQRNRISIPGRDKRFFLSAQRPDRHWGPLSLLSSGCRGLFLGVKVARA